MLLVTRAFMRSIHKCDLFNRYEDVYQKWHRLVVKFNVSGVQVHDARLVASMKVNNISHILTFNCKDFERYISEKIVAISPEQI